jgi:cation:H+ antiporter
MLNDLLTVAGGAVMLYLGAEWLVGAVTALALAFRIPQLIVGLTVVAYGTSAPEIIVGIDAAMTGHGDIALGNVIGSNVANLGLILAAAVLVRPAVVDGALPRRELPVLLLSTLCLPALLWDGRVTTIEGALLLVSSIAYTAVMVWSARSAALVREATVDAEAMVEAVDAAGAPGAASRSRGRLGLTALAGLALLLLGSHLLVAGASGMARTWGMSERLVGLTIVAVGTSIPELVTSLIAALRGHSDIAVGNVIGSNVFNVLLCLGGAALAGTVTTPPRVIGFDLATLLVMTLVAGFFIRSRRTVTRWEGGVLALMYLGFVVLILSAA